MVHGRSFMRFAVQAPGVKIFPPESSVGLGSPIMM
jgi:hypothetical protein